MKLTKSEKELYKSTYKKVKKALSTRQKAQEEEGNEIIEDILDDNYIAESKDKTPPTRRSQMNKSKGVHSPIAKDPKGGKSKLGVLNDLRNKAKKEQNTRKEVYAETEQRKDIVNNRKYNRKNKPNLPKSEKDVAKCSKKEKGIDKLKKFKEKQIKKHCK